MVDNSPTGYKNYLHVVFFPFSVGMVLICAECPLSEALGQGPSTEDKNCPCPYGQRLTFGMDESRFAHFVLELLAFSCGMYARVDARAYNIKSRLMPGPVTKVCGWRGLSRNPQ